MIGDLIEDPPGIWDSWGGGRLYQQCKDELKIELTIFMSAQETTKKSFQTLAMN